MKSGIVAIIPVKGDSERVPKKNMRKFCGTSLLEVKINQLKAVKGFDQILVSSENDDVLRLANSLGVSTHKRDSYYSTSSVPMSEVYSHLADIAQYDTVAWVNVTNPLVNSEVYDEAIAKYHKLSKKKYDCLMSVYELKEYVFYNEKPVNFEPYPWPRSQDLKGLSVPSFAINIMSREDLKSNGTLVGKSPYFFYIDPLLSTDIDVQSDFDFCEMMFSRLYGEGIE